MIVLRRRFPNFVCDGRPLGPDPEAYMSRIESTEEFLQLEWLKDYAWITEWQVSKHQGGTEDAGPDMLMGVNEEGRHWAIAYIQEGELDLPEWDG